MNLQEKVNLTREIFERVLCFAHHKHVYVAWTGGKDSTVTLSLWASFLEEKGYNSKPGAINLDTGLKFPEIIKFRDDLVEKWNVHLYVAEPDIETEEYPVARNKVSCCRDLKVDPLKRAITDLRVQGLITGIRKDEHHTRKDREQIEKKQDPAYFQINPILHWTVMDIWSFIVQQGLPYCKLYDQGYTSLGCMPCTTRPTCDAERSGRDMEKEANLEVLRSLGYF